MYKIPTMNRIHNNEVMVECLFKAIVMEVQNI